MPAGVTTVEGLHRRFPPASQRRLSELYERYRFFMGQMEREARARRGCAPKSAAHRAADDRTRRSFSLAECARREAHQELGVVFGDDGYLAVPQA